MKLASISNGASFNLKRSLFVLLYKQNRDGYPQKREGCVMDKSPFEASVTHVISLEINILSAYFEKIVMGDRCFAKNKHVCSGIPINLQHRHCHQLRVPCCIFCHWQVLSVR